MRIFLKEYVLVSQGIEIYRTTNKEEAEYIMNTGNDEYYTYLKKCIENGEPYADNEIFMFDETFMSRFIDRLADFFMNFYFFLPTVKGRFHLWLFVKNNNCVHCCLFCKHYFKCEKDF